MVATYEAQSQRSRRTSPKARSRRSRSARHRSAGRRDGTGAAALAAARTGAQVTRSTLGRNGGAVRAHGVPTSTHDRWTARRSILPMPSFDAVLSVFGVMLFPDWRAGLREMAR